MNKKYSRGLKNFIKRQTGLEETFSIIVLVVAMIFLARIFKTIPWIFYTLWICIPVSIILLNPKKVKIPPKNAKIITITANSFVLISSFFIFCSLDKITYKFSKQLFHRNVSFGTANFFEWTILTIIQIIMIIMIIIIPPLITWTNLRHLNNNNSEDNS